MSFREWLLSELLSENIVDSDTTVDDLTEDFLLTSTELDDSDIEDCRQQYAEYCRNSGLEVNDDLEEY